MIRKVFVHISCLYTGECVCMCVLECTHVHYRGMKSFTIQSENLCCLSLDLALSNTRRRLKGFWGKVLWAWRLSLASFAALTSRESHFHGSFQPTWTWKSGKSQSLGEITSASWFLWSRASISVTVTIAVLKYPNRNYFREKALF